MLIYRMEMTEDRTGELEDRSTEFTLSKWQKVDWKKWRVYQEPVCQEKNI